MLLVFLSQDKAIISCYKRIEWAIATLASSNNLLMIRINVGCDFIKLFQIGLSSLAQIMI